MIKKAFSFNRNNERFTNNYDLLRIVAALCIAFTHSFNLLGYNNNEPLMKLSGGRFDFSFIGLCIFFTISGYLIARSALNSTSLLNYLWKRFLRIQPLLILVCLLSVFLLGPLFTKLTTPEYFSSFSTYSYFRNIFPATGIQFTLPGVFTENPVESSVNGSLWTLIIEERLYLLLSVLFFLKKTNHKLFVYFIGILDLLFFADHLWDFSGPLDYFGSTPIFYSLVFLNASCAFLLKLPVTTLAKPNWALGILLVTIVCMYLEPLRPLLVLVAPLFILSVANIKAATNKAGIYGDFTYGIYIFAFPVQQIIIATTGADMQPMELFLKTVLIVVVLAMLSWHLLEKLVLQYKNRVG